MDLNLFTWGNEGEFSPSLFQDGYAENDLLRFMHLNNILYITTSAYQRCVPNAITQDDTALLTTLPHDYSKVTVRPTSEATVSVVGGHIEVTQVKKDTYIEVLLYPTTSGNKGYLKAPVSLTASADFIVKSSGVISQDAMYPIVQSIESPTYNPVWEQRDLVGGYSYTIAGESTTVDDNGIQCLVLKVPIIRGKDFTIRNLKVSYGSVVAGGVRLDDTILNTVTYGKEANVHATDGSAGLGIEKSRMTAGYARGVATYSLTNTMFRVFPLSPYYPNKNHPAIDTGSSLAESYRLSTIVNVAKETSQSDGSWGSAILTVGAKPVHTNAPEGYSLIHLLSEAKLNNFLSRYVKEADLLNTADLNYTKKATLEAEYLKKTDASNYQKRNLVNLATYVNTVGGTTVQDIILSMLTSMSILVSNHQYIGGHRTFVLTLAQFQTLKLGIFATMAQKNKESYEYSNKGVRITTRYRYGTKSTKFESFEDLNSDWLMNVRSTDTTPKVSVTVIKRANDPIMVFMAEPYTDQRSYSTSVMETPTQMQRVLMSADVSFMFDDNVSNLRNGNIDTLVNYGDKTSQEMETLFSARFPYDVTNTLIKPVVNKQPIFKGNLSTIGGYVDLGIPGTLALRGFTHLTLIYRTTGGVQRTTFPNPFYNNQTLRTRTFSFTAQNLADNASSGNLYNFKVTLSLSNTDSLLMQLDSAIARNLGTGNIGSPNVWLFELAGTTPSIETTKDGEIIIAT